VRELLLAGARRVHEVVILQDGDDGGIGALAADLRVPVRRVGRGKLEALARTESPQGVVARAAPLAEVDLEDLVDGTGRGTPFLLAVDGVTDPGNLGALLRSAEGLGVTGVVLPRHRAVHITPTVAKAAAGAIEHLPMAVVPGLPAALRELGGRGVWLVGLDMGGEPIDRLAVVDEPVALVVGAEGRGLSRLVRQRCDAIAAIPMRGRLGSLNVAVAGAIACWEVARRRGSTTR
jgi:23S rRNA (guanosine2251-2'-O)-methyltransferase